MAPDAPKYETADELRHELEAIPQWQRLKYIVGQPRERMMLFKRILSPSDRTTLEKLLDQRAEEKFVETRESRMDAARCGRATNPSDMVDVLLEVSEKLRPNDLSWIQTIDHTASEFDYHHGFTTRQEEVIRDIYRRYLPAVTGKL